MISIGKNVIKKQPKFWNHAVFHPTDAIEDPWGKRILDRMSADGAIKTIRIYSMFEDIVYADENGKLCYDFRLNDLRIDYLLEKGYDPLFSYAAMPDCISQPKHSAFNCAKNKTRYKAKNWNSAPPKDYGLWEEVCYQYTKHLVERYGEDTVSKWYCHCHNEPDHAFWMNDVKDYAEKCTEYCKLYSAFVRGVRRASKGIRLGGPALSWRLEFLDLFLAYVKETGVEMNYIALHAYGSNVHALNAGVRPIATENISDIKLNNYMEIVRKHGFGDTEIILDEWGASAMGFYNIEECPALIFREHEVYSAYLARLIYQLIETGIPISKMMICLSGQHEMVTDFSGFRNFFTLNFIAKPIYNAHVMTSKMEDLLVKSHIDRENVYAVSTKNETGCYSTLLTYSTKLFEEDLPDITEELSFEEDITGKTVTVYCIDKTHTNPYRLYQRMGIENEPTEEELKILRAEGNLVPLCSYVSDGSPVKLELTANCTFLVLIQS